MQHSSEGFRNLENPRLRKGLDKLTSSLNQIGDTFEKAFEVRCLGLYFAKALCSDNYNESDYVNRNVSIIFHYMLRNKWNLHKGLRIRIYNVPSSQN